MKNEVCDDVEVNGELFEEQNLVAIKIDYQDAVVNGVHANGGIIEVEEVLEGDWTKSPLNANGKAKKSSLERYPRRFTRSALKSKEDIVAKGNDYVDQSEGNSKGVMYEGNGEVCKDIVVFSEASRSENTEMAVVTVDIGTVVPVKSSENAECDAGKDSEEPSSAVPRRKLEMKMSKQISQGKVPSNVQELLATEPFSSMDAESSEPVCSKCVMLNLSSVGPVYSTRKRYRSDFEA
uniref:Uncharacterized protein n=1 Tax=Chenopodium quinoa TaxID=63459 RepID=A0A803NBE1_CHEQI